MMFTLGLFAILGLIIFVVVYTNIQNERARENRRMAIEELEALKKHGIRYHYTPAEKERLAYLKAVLEEDASCQRSRQGGSALGAAAMIGLAAYTIHQGNKDNERYARDLRRNYR